MANRLRIDLHTLELACGNYARFISFMSHNLATNVDIGKW